MSRERQMSRKTEILKVAVSLLLEASTQMFRAKPMVRGRFGTWQSVSFLEHATSHSSTTLDPHF